MWGLLRNSKKYLTMIHQGREEWREEIIGRCESAETIGYPTD